jgi:molecular chaperone GrpE (heat shock protein)
LEVRQLEQEVTEIWSDATRVSQDTELEHVTKLSRELVDMKGKVARLDQDLANIARELRTQIEGQILPTTDYFRRQVVATAAFQA